MKSILDFIKMVFKFVKKFAKKHPTIFGMCLAITVCAVLFLTVEIASTGKSEPEVVGVSTLEKIVNINELATFSAVYNGIAEVANEKKPEKIDYYVSYEATIEAGVDCSLIEISVDDEKHIVTIDVPEAHIINCVVDETTLDFIFKNNKVNDPTITQVAHAACKEDVQKESKELEAICDLAEQNAIHMITALTKPLIEQTNSEYELVVK